MNNKTKKDSKNMKNDLNQGIIIGGWKTNTTPNDLDQIKLLLNSFYKL